MKKTMSLKARALKFLSLREHSRIELSRKLFRHTDDESEVESVLLWLEEHQFLSNERFVESFVNQRTSRYGNQKILYELQKHDVPTNLVTDLKTELKESELERAVSVLHRRFVEAPVDDKEKVRQMRFLQQRGFSHEVIYQAMKAPREEE